MGYRAMRMRFLDLEPEEVFAQARAHEGDHHTLDQDLRENRQARCPDGFADPDLADATYIEPLTPEALTRKVREVAMVGRALLFTGHPVLAQIVPARFCNLSCTYCNEFDKVSQPWHRARLRPARPGGLCAPGGGDRAGNALRQ